MIVFDGTRFDQNQCKIKAQNENCVNNLIDKPKISKQNMLHGCDGTTNANVECLKQNSVGTDADTPHLSKKMPHTTEPHESAFEAATVFTNDKTASETQHTELNTQPVLSLVLKKKSNIVEKQFGESCISFVIEAQSMKRKQSVLPCALPIQHNSHGSKQKKVFMSCLGLVKKVTHILTGTSTKQSRNSRGSVVSPSSKPEVRSPPTELKLKSNFQYYGTGKLPCPDLGEGWFFEQIVRLHGKSAGQYDVYYYSPNKVRLRSKLKLQDHLGSPTSLTSFDYNCGRFFGPNEKSVCKKDALLTGKLKWCKDSKPRIFQQNKRETTEGFASPVLPLRSLPQKRKPLEKLKLKWCKRRKLYESCKPKEDRALNARSTNACQLLPSAENEMGYEVFKQEIKRNCAGIGNELLPLELITIKAWELLSDEKKAFYFSGPASDPGASKLKSLPLSYRKLIPGKRRRKQRCGCCAACLSVNCGKCATCRDMKQFGGKGKMKQSCLYRRCKNKILPEGGEEMNAPPSFKKQKRSSSIDAPFSFACSLLQENIDTPPPVEQSAESLSFSSPSSENAQSAICPTTTLSLAHAQSDQLITSVVCTETNLSTALDHDTLNAHLRTSSPSQPSLQSSSSPKTFSHSSSTSYLVNQSNENSSFSSELPSKFQPVSETLTDPLSGDNNHFQFTSSQCVKSTRSEATDESKVVAEAEKSIEKCSSDSGFNDIVSRAGIMPPNKDNPSTSVARGLSSLNSKPNDNETLKLITKSSAEFDLGKLDGLRARSDGNGDELENIPSEAEAKNVGLHKKSETEPLRVFASDDNLPTLRQSPPNARTEVDSSAHELQLTVLDPPTLRQSPPNARTEEDTSVDSSAHELQLTSVDSSAHELQLTVLDPPSLASSISSPSNNGKTDDILSCAQSETPIMKTPPLTSASDFPTVMMSESCSTVNSALECSSDNLQLSGLNILFSSNNLSFSNVDAQNSPCGVDENPLPKPVMSGVDQFEPTACLSLDCKDRETGRDWENVIDKFSFPESNKSITTSAMNSPLSVATTSRQTSVIKSSSELPCSKKSPKPFINPLKVLNTTTHLKSFVNPEVLKRKRSQNLSSLEIGITEPYFSRCGVRDLAASSASPSPTITPTIISLSAQPTQNSLSPFLNRKKNSELTAASEKTTVPSYFDANLSRDVTNKVSIKEDIDKNKSNLVYNNTQMETHTKSDASQTVSRFKPSSVIRKSTKGNYAKKFNLPFF